MWERSYVYIDALRFILKNFFMMVGGSFRINTSIDPLQPITSVALRPTPTSSDSLFRLRVLVACVVASLSV